MQILIYLQAYLGGRVGSYARAVIGSGFFFETGHKRCAIQNQACQPRLPTDHGSGSARPTSDYNFLTVLDVQSVSDANIMHFINKST